MENNTKQNKTACALAQADGFSDTVFWKDLGEVFLALYKGDEPALPPLGTSFADFALWQGATLYQSPSVVEGFQHMAQLCASPRPCAPPPAPALLSARLCRVLRMLPLLCGCGCNPPLSFLCGRVGRIERTRFDHFGSMRAYVCVNLRTIVHSTTFGAGFLSKKR